MRVSGPQECADLHDAPLAGSFTERCDLCMHLAGALGPLWHEATTIEAAATADGRGEEGAEGVAEGPAARVCAEAAVRAEALLPTVRTCRYHPPACHAVIAAAREHACPEVWAMRRAGATERAVRARERELCGLLATQRNGSGVSDALVCPHPRDVGARIMAICAVVASVLLAAQARLGVYAGLGGGSGHA